MPGLLNGNLVLIDNLPVPRPANGPPCSDGTLEAVKAGRCVPSKTFVVIPFREIGDFVFHCHILEHEDGGMMAAILTSAWSIARRPAAEAPEWWPASLCLADDAAMTPAKIRRAQRRERGRARAAAAPADPA